MAKLYTNTDMQRILRQLRIKPTDGTVTTRETAAIWTWRAENELHTPHVYKDSAPRQRVKQGHLKPTNGDSRPSRFTIEDVFHVSLAPNRAKSHEV